MAENTSPRARVSMFIESPPETVYAAFVEPDALTRFWLSESSAPLELGKTVHWRFMVEGAEVDTTATAMDHARHLAWDWETDSRVMIDFEAVDGGTAVTVINDGFRVPGDKLVDAALNATEGFAIVLADLKTLLESGRSAGITAAKARLITLRR